MNQDRNRGFYPVTFPKWEGVEAKHNSDYACDDICFLKRDSLWRKFLYNILKIGYWKFALTHIPGVSYGKRHAWFWLFGYHFGYSSTIGWVFERMKSR